MIFVDANAFLRALAQPRTPEDHANAQRARTLFVAVQDGAAKTTTSAAMLAEVVFILSSPRHDGSPRATAAAGFKVLLLPPTCRLPAKDVCLRALDVWVELPKLSFSDALAAAYSELRGHEVATFDAALAQTPGVTRYPPFG